MTQPFPANNQAPAPIPLQAPRPRARKMNPWVIGGIVGAMALLIVLSLVMMFQPRVPRTHHVAEANTEWVKPALRLEGYDKLPRKPAPPTEPPQPPPAAPPPAAPTQRAAPQAAKATGPTEAEKAEDAARKSPLFFQDDRKTGGRASAITPPLLPPAAPEEPAGGKLPGGRQGFLQQASALQPTQVQDRLHTPESPYMLLAGTVIPASLLTGISSELPGTLTAQVREAVYDTVTGRYLLVPQGARFIGAYDSQVVYGEKRLLVAWQRLIFPNGMSLQLEGMPGTDLGGTAGLEGHVNTHFWALLRAVFMSSVLSVGSRVPFGNTRGYNQTLPQEFGQDFGQAANQAGQSIVQRELNRKPTIDVPAGKSFHVLVHRDVILQPYTEGVARAR